VPLFHEQETKLSAAACMHSTGSAEASSAAFSSLHSLLEKIEQETWRETGISFVTSVTRLMERLLDYRYLTAVQRVLRVRITSL